MNSATEAVRRARGAGLLVAATLALPACGGSKDDYANNPRPPAPINVAAAITDEKISVSPLTFGAGPISLIVSNQSTEPQQVTFETSDFAGSPGVKQTTSPINPRGTATLKVDVAEGSYEVSVENPDIKSVSIEVGPKRPSSQNDLLQP